MKWIGAAIVLAAGLALMAALGVPGPWAWLALLVVVGVLPAASRWQAVAQRRQLELEEAELQLRRAREESEQLRRRSEQQEQLEHELLHAKQAAEAAALAKGEFLATMSHEIRTPLNGIIPMLDMLGEGALDEGQRRMLGTAADSSQQLLRIVDDILDYSRLEANALTLEITTFNLRELLDGVVQLMQRAAEAKGLRLRMELDPAVRLSVRGDPVRLRQVLSNLLANAIKFTAKGEVTLHVMRQGSNASRHELRFEVRDTGIGISRDQQARLFQSFSQADASTTRMYGGTGLGLAICRRIIDLMKGSIGVESEPNQGATFWFEIPLLKALGDLSEVRGRGHGRLLVFSTDDSLAHRVRRVAEHHALDVERVETLGEALDAVRAGAAPGRPALAWLLVDARSLRNGGPALRQAIRERGPADAMQVLWLGGNESDVEPHHRQHWRSVLDDDGDLHTLFSPVAAVLEPVRDGPLLPNLARQAAAQIAAPLPRAIPAPNLVPSAAMPPASAVEPTVQDLRVLLVEDNGVNMMVARRLLEASGCRVQCVEDGQQALDALHAGGIDVVLMDCQMPVLDGYDATRQWRAHEAAQGLPRRPIIAMTANAMAGDRERCLQAGMDDYLSKPIHRPSLLACLQHWAPVAKAAMPAPAAIPTPTATTMLASTQAALDTASEPVLDREVLDELHEVIGDEVMPILAAFLQDTPTLVTQLQAAADAADNARLRALAHSLKSSSANVGAMALSAAALHIEVSARDGTLTDPVAATTLALQAFTQARVALEHWVPAPV